VSVPGYRVQPYRGRIGREQRVGFLEIAEMKENEIDCALCRE